jgi:hypothetical protein
VLPASAQARNLRNLMSPADSAGQAPLRHPSSTGNRLINKIFMYVVGERNEFALLLILAVAKARRGE